MESSTTEDSKDISHTGKRENRDIHTTNKPTSFPTEDTTVTGEYLTTSIPEESSTSTVKSTIFEDKPSTSNTTESTTEESLMTMDVDVVADSTLTISSTPTDFVTVESTTKKNLTEKSEPIAVGIVVDSTTEKPTTKESNPNYPTSSTMPIELILGLIVGSVAAIGVVGGVIKKLCGGNVKHFDHEALALAELALVELDNRLDNNEDTSLTGNVNNMDV